MSTFFLRTNTVYLAIWIALMLYGFYRYYKKVNFKNMSLMYLVFISLTCTFMGFITGMFLVDFGFVLLLICTSMFVQVGKYYFVEKTRQVLILISAYFVVVIVSHFMTIRCKNSFLSKVFILCFLVGVFLLGVKGFFYYLAHDFRK